MQFSTKITTNSPRETKTLGKRIGKSLKSGSVLALNGELGSGKTCFVQGLAKGLEVPDNYYITSPTYTLINRYPGRLPFFHVDLYRIEESYELEEIGFYEILDGKGVVAIEWADRINNNLTSEFIEARFKIIDDTTRKIFLITYGHACSNLIMNLVLQSENIS